VEAGHYRPGNNYRCKECNAEFERAIDLANHVRKEHPKEKTPKSTREIPLPSDLIATDGKTPIDNAARRRGEVTEIVGSMRLMRDPQSGLTWIERLA
jgi:hypothetical protein